MALLLPGYRFNVWDDKGNGTCNTDFIKGKGKLGGEGGIRTHAVRHHLRGGPENWGTRFLPTGRDADSTALVLHSKKSGEGGIRTHGTTKVHTISSRADSTALAPLRTVNF